MQLLTRKTADFKFNRLLSKTIFCTMQSVVTLEMKFYEEKTKVYSFWLSYFCFDITLEIITMSEYTWCHSEKQAVWENKLSSSAYKHVLTLVIPWSREGAG